MKQITPGSAVPTILGQAPRVMSEIRRTSSNDFWQSGVRDASPGDATPTTAVWPLSLQRSNIQFFLRSIAKNSRPK
jgi:hypothetical protein